MKSFNHRTACRRVVLPVIGILTGLLAGGVRAQQRAVAAPAAEVRIRDLPKMGRAALVRTPEFQSNVARTMRGAHRKHWAVLEVVYETAPEWMDELSFTFYLMTQDAQKQYNYFETSVTYVDIAKGDHSACVVLPSAAVDRYGEPNAFGVDIFVGGQRVATKSVGAVEEWWKLLADRPNINKRSGYLVDRSKTPFAWAHIDDYEAVR